MSKIWKFIKVFGKTVLIRVPAGFRGKFVVLSEGDALKISVNGKPFAKFRKFVNEAFVVDVFANGNRMYFDNLRVGNTLIASLDELPLVVFDLEI